MSKKICVQYIFLNVLCVPILAMYSNCFSNVWKCVVVPAKILVYVKVILNKTIDNCFTHDSVSTNFLKCQNFVKYVWTNKK